MTASAIRDLLARTGRLLFRTSAQTVPAAGVLGLSWHPAAGLLLYWVESVLALGATALLLALFARRARAPGREAERAAIVQEGIVLDDVLLVHGGAFGIFGLFLAGFLGILVAKGHVPAAGLGAALAGVPLLAACVALELGIDLARFRTATARDLARRVNAGNLRFVLFWIVGFFGIAAAILLGKPLALFALFAGVKLLFETVSLLARGRSAARERPPEEVGGR